jgi:hypothetical protein
MRLVRDISPAKHYTEPTGKLVASTNVKRGLARAKAEDDTCPRRILSPDAADANVKAMEAITNTTSETMRNQALPAFADVVSDIAT